MTRDDIISTEPPYEAGDEQREPTREDALADVESSGHELTSGPQVLHPLPPEAESVPVDWAAAARRHCINCEGHIGAVYLHDPFGFASWVLCSFECLKARLDSCTTRRARAMMLAGVAAEFEVRWEQAAVRSETGAAWALMRDRLLEEMVQYGQIALAEMMRGGGDG